MRDRVLYSLKGPEPGPTLVILTAIHGNEPAGVEGALRLARRIEEAGGLRRGEVVALIGHRAAFARGRRYLDRDLNRLWKYSPAEVDHLREGRERRGLTRSLATILRRARGPVRLMDVHTTSGLGPPFTVVGDSEWGRAMADRLPVPRVLGLARRISGTISEWLDRQGVGNLVLEAGAHTDPDSSRRTEQILRLAATLMGLVDSGALDESEATGDLVSLTRTLPPILELVHRHPVRPEDRFEMRPGYRNLAPIRKEEVLARDRNGPVHSPLNGWILLPLYQLQGEDGFFVVVPARRYPEDGTLRPAEEEVLSSRAESG
ncbi:MAG: hypothetical protein EA351_13040 [Gemmatimonadales bacterium]|nr:MAG: hypothetical protein EA351_13040 [Gemmatimonadales bacterium]